MVPRLIIPARLSLAILAASAALPALAAEQSWTLSGGALDISSPCARAVEIAPSSTAREITVRAVADHQEEIDSLSVSSGGTGVTVGKQTNRCPFSQSRKKETMRLTITLPAGSDLKVHNGNSADYRVRVPVGDFDLHLSGSGGITAEQVSGLLRVRLSGSGGAVIKEMAGKDARLHVTGSGGIAVGGNIGRLEIDLTGSGDARVASAASAEVETSGSGGVRADSINGNLSFRATGSGGMDIGSISADRVSIRTSGDGGISVRDGRIGRLEVSGTGSADARIDAVVDSADLSTSGSGNLDIRRVTGPVQQRRTGSGGIRIGG